jgi:4-hydroxymandelate oxidase
MSFVPQVQPLPSGLACLGDYEAHARAAIEPAVWSYINGGAADEITLRANCAAWDRIQLLPRVLRPMAHGHMRVELLGRTLDHPILLGPVAYQRLAHPEGELATAHAAAAQGAGIVLSTQSSVRMEDVATAIGREPGRGPLWFQLYFQPDREVTRDLVRRAEQAGYDALVVTVDAAVHGARDRQRRAGFRLPPDVRAANLEGYRPPEPAGGELFQQLAQAPTWRDIEWLQSTTRLPVLLKGVLHPDDARQAAELGLAGLVISNHGGRTLDTACPTSLALPRIAAAVGDALPLLVDGGIRRGTDVLKALALGARAVLVGQPQLWGLATGGAVGVAHMLRLLRDELAIAMALCGCATVADAGPALLSH